MTRWHLTPARALALDAIELEGAADECPRIERAVEAVLFPARVQGEVVRSAARMVRATAAHRAVVLREWWENPDHLGLEQEALAESRARLAAAVRDLLAAVEVA